MIWRSAIVSGYIALAIVISIAYGGQGLIVLSFFYFWAGAWVTFLLVWGWAARAAGRWNVRRLDSPPSRAERDGSPPHNREPRAAELSAFDVRDSLRAADAKRRRPAPAL